MGAPVLGFIPPPAVGFPGMFINSPVVGAAAFGLFLASTAVLDASTPPVAGALSLGLFPCLFEVFSATSAAALVHRFPPLRGRLYSRTFHASIAVRSNDSPRSGGAFYYSRTFTRVDGGLVLAAGPPPPPVPGAPTIILGLLHTLMAVWSWPLPPFWGRLLLF